MQPAKVMQPDGDLERRKAALSVQQRAALRERILRGKSGSHSSVPRVSNSATPPLSFAQERIWLHEQLVPQSVVYNRPANIRLRGPLQVDPLIRALRHAVSRHESIWMTVEASTITPSSKVQPPYDFDIPFSDLTHESDGAGRVPELVKAEAVRPFDLNQVPLLRSHLLRLGDDDHLLLLTFHHFCFDAWSQAVLLREFAAAYQAFVNNEQPALIAPVIRYSDFAAWDRSTERVHALSRGRSYWKRELQAPPTLQLPTDHSRLTVPSEAAGHVNFELKPPLVQTIQALAQSEGTTFFAVTLAAWQTLLYRYSGESDLVIGCPFAGRNRVESEELIGVFINTLPLRARISDGDTFRQLLRRTGVTVLAGLEHQEVPLQFIVQDILTDRDASGSPLFQAMFIHERFSIEARTSAGVIFEPEDGPAAATMVDLSLEIMESAVSVTGRLNYRLELWDHSTIERMTGHFVKLLEGIVADPDQRVSELPLLTEPERHQLLVEWNDTAVEYPRDKCVHELFEEQVARTPDAVAGIFEEQELTYRELNERANQLAHHLIALGVGPETLVGLCLERSAELVVGILGILKAGGAYVPLDADYPPQRLEFMLRDSKLQFIVTQQGLRDRLPVCDWQAVYIELAYARIEVATRSNPASGVRVENLAYVMFTSGSTGTPKGVAIEHRSVANLLSSMCQFLTEKSLHKFLGVASPTFDISVAELFTPLIIGGATLLPSRRDSKDPQLLAAMIDHLQPSVIQATPATWSALVENGWNADTEKTLISTGEALPKALGRQLLKLGRLFDLYGPTETTIWSCQRHLQAAEQIGSIGTPISNTQVYVLDEHRQPLPIGVPGELYIGGAGLARGYLNRPELTAEKFVGNPFSDHAESRLYRTGDLCRWRADGNLEFLGRLDDQVKLRGFRIELGEIEAVLNEHADVAQNVVILREDCPGDKRLVAYCVPAAGTGLKLSELRNHLRNRLPEYMLPAAFVELKSFPLTSSGKINRRGLPAPDDSRPDLETHYVAPRTPIEQQLASIWAEVLGIDAIGIHDNFFALGGHSLLATRVNARISSAFQVDLPLRKLFEAPTIAEFASEIETLRSGGLIARSTALTRVDRDQIDRLPLSFAQQRLWFLEQMEGELTAYNMPYGWKLRGSLDVEALRRALEEIVQRHEPLRTTFAMLDDAPVQVIQPSGQFELPVEDLSSLAAEQQDAEILTRCRLEAEKPFNLSTDLMLRASLLHLGDDEHMLLLTMHHIASDGWSLRILWRELAGLYDAYCRGAESNLRELPVQYADYAIWQRSELEGQRLEQLLQYWREQLKGVSPLELPTDHPRPARPTYRGAKHRFELPEALVSQLKRLSQTAGVTLHMTLLAAFQTLLSRYSGQDDIAVGVPIAGRNHAELEDLIGFFVNTLVLRTDLSADPTFRELLGRVREVSLAAYHHQDLPFEKLVEELRPERDLSRSPLFQVLFQLLNFADEELALQNLDVSRLPSGSQRVRFDLEMHVWQRDKTLRGRVVYSTDLFDHSTIARMVGHFITLLQGIVAAPDQRISQLPLLTEPERQQLLVEWNDTAADHPRDKCVHELFEEQVERTPDAVAVIFEEQELTYRELNERANQLAHHLIALGVGPETLVGLCLERSPELVVGILGILKAGGAYVPLDADYPPQRLEFMLQDAAVKYLVTQPQLRGRLPVADCAVICLDTEPRILQYTARSNPSVDVGADNLAYVMYTSGSTGKPKGVAIRHRSIERLVFGNDYTSFGPDRVFLQLATPSFDASTFELWGALLHGAKLVVAHVGLPDFRQLEDLLKRNRVTTLWLTATFLNQVVEHYPQALNRVEEILTGGEALSVRHIGKARAALGSGVQFVNGYGPTESTTFATCYQIPSDVAPEQESIPIGRPIANTQVYVLDEHRQPLPIGVPGELYIGGAGLARGYLNRPELTAEKFVGNPFSDHAESRLYRTGDLCRWRSDGNLEFLGRMDDQVKLRGFRIELGEIESVLNEHPSVAQGVVTLREDRPGDKRLVAYCVAASDSELKFSELRSYVQQRLPDYMLPAAFVRLDSLPLTPSGKVNRRGLPAPDDSRPELDTGFVAPRTPIEQQLSAIWSEVLGIDEIGIHDNFFALGGHSLLATRVNARISSALQVNLPLRTLFEAPTIAELVLRFEAHQQRPRPEPTTDTFLSIVRPSTGCGTVICVGGHVTELAKSLSQSIGIIYLGSGSMEPVRFHQFGIEGVVERYVTELLQARLQGPLVIVGYSYSGLVAYALATRLRQLLQDQVVAVLLEPALPKIPRNPVRDLVLRIGGYVRKLCHHGPSVFYASVRFRLKKYVQKRQLAAVPEAHQDLWQVIAPQLYRNVAAFSPSPTLVDGVHLVAGAPWLSGQFGRFQTQLSESPCILNLGEVTHDEAVNKQECIASWTRLIREILGDRERPGVSMPDVTPGMHHVGEIRAL